MVNNFFNSRAKTVTFAAILLATSALISRILGLIRDRLLAGTFGAGKELDVYFAAFQVPDFVYGILIAGGITTAFLPVFSEYFQKGEKATLELTNNVLNCFLVLLILFCGILFIFTPFLIEIIAPGFSPEQKSLTTSLTRIMFLSPIFFGLSSIFSGVLQYFHRFLVYSFAPILYNLSIIFGILFLVPVFGIFGLAYGVILGAFLHWVIQIPSVVGIGFKYRPLFNFKFPGLKKIFKLMIPRTIGIAAQQLNLIVVTAIASTLTIGSITVFNFSNNLQSLPIGLIGISFAMASFPILSRMWAAGFKEKFLENFSLAFRQILFLAVPISLLMFILRAQIVRLVLGTGQFGWLETRLTAASLGIFCFGILAFSLIPLVARAFFSFQDTKTPVIIGLVSMALNIALCFLFVFVLKSSNFFQEFIIRFLKLEGIEGIEVVGLPFALSISGTFQFLLLLRLLQKKIGDFRLREILSSLKKIIIASFFTGIITYLILQLGANFVNMKTFMGVLIQTTLAGVLGVFVYIAASYLLKSPEIKTIRSSILKEFTPMPNGDRR